MAVTAVDLEALGITKDELVERVVDKIVDTMLTNRLQGDDDRVHQRDSEFHNKVSKHVCVRIDQAVATMADKIIVPNVETFIANFKMKETNSWGEQKGKEWTFTEWLVERADRWMQEPVNSMGKTREQDSYSWRQSSTRLGHAVYEHLDYRIKDAMEKALGDLNKQLGQTVAKTIEMQLTEVLSRLQKKATT